MAAPLGKSMKRLESRKSHSWWWDSHVSTKNSKWLSDNLEEMDKSIKRMLKLIEEDGDSFAKKVEMYYQKRPELISHVEDFYRMYRSLAERYDHVTGELRKNIPSDLQSQGSGVSDITSELNSTPISPDHRSSRRRSGHRAAGFDFFLGSGGNGTDNFQKEGDELSSLTDSETESDCSSVNNYINFGNGGGDQGFRKKMLELEIEPRDVKERLRLQQEDSRAENSNDSFSRVNEHELRIANEKIQDSEEEIARLRVELQKLRSLDVKNFLQEELQSPTKREFQTPFSEDLETNQVTEFQDQQNEFEEAVKSDRKIQALVEELKMTKDRLKDSENEINSLRDELETNRSSDKIRKLQDQLQLTQKEVATWKAKLNSQKREVSKLQDRISMLKSSLSDRDHEVRDLKTAVSDAEQKIFPEKSQVKAEISKLLEERICFEEQIKELESQGRYLEDEIRKIKVEKAELEERFTAEIGKLKTQVFERGNTIESLNRGVDALRTERDELNAVVVNLKAEVSNKDDQIDQMHKELQQLGNERVEMIAGAEMTVKLVEDLKLRARELEDEVERQRVSILEGAERKREAIRQLCFSLEHYRDEYVTLRKACRGSKRVSVLKTNLVV